MNSVLFYAFSGTALLSAFCVITASRPTRALLALIVTMFALAVLYLLLGAAFIAMVHLIVYAGAVLVLFLFVIMLQGVGARDLPLARRFHIGYIFLAVFTAASFAGISLFLVSQMRGPRMRGVYGSVESIAQALFRDYLLPFELVSLLLILGVLAAVGLAGKEDAS